ncbi:MAG: amidohydrolase family protein [Elusimicrobia bacterium]|nr:amidohydrolase family protein [Elusimicrobiota bacterium]
MKTLDCALLTLDRRERLVYWPAARLTLDKGRIAQARPLGRKARPGALLAIPGLVDAHCHLPQYPAVAADGGELLPWLKKHIFPLERRFKGSYARELSRLFFKDLAAHGTTAAAVYLSVYKEGAEAAFEEGARSGLRLVMGKVMMDRGSYDDAFARKHPRRGRAEVSLQESGELCARWNGAAEGRLRYAYTPRFALSCSRELMRAAGAEAARRGAFVQTHLSESRAEIAAVRRDFPEARNYADVYGEAGLLGPRTLLAHGIWLSDAERRTVKASGSVLVHCPTSNAFLSSGVMDLPAARGADCRLALGSDVAAGPSLDLLEVMRQAVFAQRLAGAHKLFSGAADRALSRGSAASEVLGAAKAFALATVHGARALDLPVGAGTLTPGAPADLVLVDPAEYDPFAPAPDGTAALARLVFRGSRHAVRATFVAGKLVWGKA